LKSGFAHKSGGCGKLVTGRLGAVVIQNRVVRWLASGLFYINLTIAAVLAVFGGFSIFEQVRMWLKEGVWMSAPLRSSLEYLGVLDPNKMVIEEWVGVSMIAEWFLDFHVALVLFTLALIIAGIGAYYEDKYLDGTGDEEA